MSTPFKIDDLVLTLFLTVVSESGSFLSADLIKNLIKDSNRFVDGEIWIRLDAVTKTITCMEAQKNEV